MKRFISASLVIITFLVGIFTIHHFFPSMLNGFSSPLGFFDRSVDSVYLENTLIYHEDHPAFARRPLTSIFVRGIHDISGLEYGYSFIVVQFLFLFGGALALYYLSLHLLQDHKKALLSLVLFFVSFSILFSFFGGVNTYDEPLQYLCIFLSLLFLYRKKFILFSIFFFFSILARETSVLLVPAIIYIVWKWDRLEKNKAFFSLGLSLVLSVIFFVVYMYGRGLVDSGSTYLLNERLEHWKFNFQNLMFSIESTVSIILAIGWQISVGLISKSKMSDKQKTLLQATLITFVINTIIVLFTARAREVRLFTLPLVFLWPILGVFTEQIKNIFKIILKKPLFFLVSFFISFLFVWKAYIPTATAGFHNGYRLYLFCVLLFIFFVLYLVSLKKNEFN